MGNWVAAFVAVAVYLLPHFASGRKDSISHTAAVFFVYFFLFFGLGYFIYATIYVLVGSMVTNTPEGGQMAMPIVFMLVAGLYLAFPVIRAPNSSFAFWVSMVPFFSPITMMVRIVSQQPPFWQIALRSASAVSRCAFVVAGCANLPHRHVDVWEASHDSRSCPLGQAIVKNTWPKPVARAGLLQVCSGGLPFISFIPGRFYEFVVNRSID